MALESVGAEAPSSIQTEAEASAYENDNESGSGDSSTPDDLNRVISTEGPQDPSGEISSPNDGDGSIAIPAASERINETMAQTPTTL